MRISDWSSDVCSSDLAALADAVEVAETAFEDRLQATRVAATALRAGIELGKVRPGPEALLEAVGLVLGAAEQAALAEADHPRRDRADPQQQHPAPPRDRGMQQQLTVVQDAARGPAAGAAAGHGRTPGPGVRAP